MLYAYDPYGNPLVSQAPGTLAERNPLRYRGYCFDAESGYYHMPARYYDPASARFVSVDPAAPLAGDPVSLNGYSYCFGDPVDFSDPTGAGADMDGDGRQTAVDTTGSTYVANPMPENRAATVAANAALRKTGSAADAAGAGTAARNTAAMLIESGMESRQAVATAIAGAVGYLGNPRPAHSGAVTATYYDDVCVGGAFGVVGVIVNHYSDGSVRRLYYWGPGLNTPLPSVSWMRGHGETVAGLAVEASAGCLYGVAAGGHTDFWGPGQGSAYFQGACRHLKRAQTSCSLAIWRAS